MIRKITLLVLLLAPFVMSAEPADSMTCDYPELRAEINDMRVKFINNVLGRQYDRSINDLAKAAYRAIDDDEIRRAYSVAYDMLSVFGSTSDSLIAFMEQAQADPLCRQDVTAAVWASRTAADLRSRPFYKRVKGDSYGIRYINSIIDRLTERLRSVRTADEADLGDLIKYMQSNRTTLPRGIMRPPVSQPADSDSCAARLATLRSQLCRMHLNYGRLMLTMPYSERKVKAALAYLEPQDSTVTPDAEATAVGDALRYFPEADAQIRDYFRYFATQAEFFNTDEPDQWYIRVLHELRGLPVYQELKKSEEGRRIPFLEGVLTSIEELLLKAKKQSVPPQYVTFDFIEQTMQPL